MFIHNEQTFLSYFFRQPTPTMMLAHAFLHQRLLIAELYSREYRKLIELV